MLLEVVVQSLKLYKLLSQQLPTFLMLRGRQSVHTATMLDLFAQLNSNIVEATQVHYTWSP